jgi:hypothetical protein
VQRNARADLVASPCAARTLAKRRGRRAAESAQILLERQARRCFVSFTMPSKSGGAVPLDFFDLSQRYNVELFSLRCPLP